MAEELRDIFNEVRWGPIQVILEDGRPVKVPKQIIERPTKIEGITAKFEIWKDISIVKKDINNSLK